MANFASIVGESQRLDGKCPEDIIIILFLGEMQRVAFSPIYCYRQRVSVRVGVFVCVCLCMSVRLVHEPTENGLR